MQTFELPEIEIWRRDLERDLIGRKVKSVEVNTMKAFDGHRTKKSVSDPLEGAKVTTVDRRGMWIVIGFDNDHTLLFRGGPFSAVQRVASKADSDSNTQLTISFTQGGDLRFIEPDDGSTIAVVADGEVEDRLDLPRGVDFFAQPVSWVDFRNFILQFDVPLRVLLVDSDVFTGIGDIYADEILFESGLRYDRSAAKLSNQEIRRLYRALVGIVHDAIKYGGTSLEQRPYADVMGTPGGFGEHLQVWGREGELSARSRAPIQRTTFEGYTVYYCETQV